ncbi:NUDIX domain-containing protein [soil metagenome]
MANLQQYPAHICLTVAAVLIQKDKVLLVKHKKLGIWLSPGGHIEANEMPHRAAEREYFEETNIRVKALDWQKVTSDPDSEYLPNPVSTNLHWVSEENYASRQADPEHYQPLPQWKRGCEQHLNFLYVVEPVDSVEFTQNFEETDGIEWFDLNKLATYELKANIKTDLQNAWKVSKAYAKK